MAFVERNGVRLNWWEQGAGTPVLLIMGATFSSRLWYPVVEALATNHRVIGFDNRGTGQSQATAMASIEDMAADGVAVLEAAGESSAHVYGISLGGVVALELAIANPARVRSLVLGCTGVLTREKPRAPKWLDVRFRLPMSVTLALGKNALYGPNCPPANVEKDLAILREETPDRVGLVAQQDALRAYAVTVDAVARLTMPALVLHGTVDRVVPLKWGEELAATLPSSRLVKYKGAGHNFLIFAPDAANAEVVAFLDGVDSPS